MDILVVIFVVMAAFVVIGSGVWVAAVLVALISATRAMRQDRGRKSADARGEF